MGEGNEGVYIESWRFGRHVDGVTGDKRTWKRDPSGVVRRVQFQGPVCGVVGTPKTPFRARVYRLSDSYHCAAAQIDSSVEVRTVHTRQTKRRHFTFTYTHTHAHTTHFG